MSEPGKDAGGSASGGSATDRAYDTFRYDNLPVTDTHPDRLHLVGSLLGATPVPATRCRVLELGCGRGANLVAMASVLPDSTFVGVDLAPAQIADAQRDAAALGLDNVRFLALDLVELPSARDLGGPFDHLICHGVYSWVPAAVRQRILERCRTHLAPDGLAYVSYNALPGWHARGAIRSVLRRVVRPGPAPRMAADARRFLAMWREHGAVEHLEPWLSSELDLIDDRSDRYLYFEHLVEENTAFYLEQFVADAAAAGLGYLGDTDLASAMPEQLGRGGPEVIAAETDDVVAAEQLLDHLTMRSFHRSLLCHGEVVPGPRFDPRHLVAAHLVTDLRAVEGAGSAGSDGAAGSAGSAGFVGADGRRLEVGDPGLSRLLAALAGAGPAGCSTVALAGEIGRPATETAAVVMDLFRRGQITAGSWRRPVVAVVPEQPVALRLARWQAAQDRDSVTTLRHDQLRVDTLERVLLEALDGTRDAPALEGCVRAAQATGRLELLMDEREMTDPEVITELVTLKLERLHRAGLLIDPELAPEQQRPVPG